MSYTLEIATQDIIDAPEGYIAVHGTLSYDADAWPVTDWDRQHLTPQMTRIRATVTGQSLNKSGFAVPMTREVTLEVGCAGPWCPGPVTSDAALIFLKTNDAGLSVEVGACHSHVFADPAQQDLDVTHQRFIESLNQR